MTPISKYIPVYKYLIFYYLDFLPQSNLLMTTPLANLIFLCTLESYFESNLIFYYLELVYDY